MPPEELDTPKFAFAVLLAFAALPAFGETLPTVVRCRTLGE
jgi:hypothetical protein